MPTDAPAVWTTAQRRLHWWTAFLVLMAFSVSWVMVGWPTRDLLAKFLLYQFHKTIGLAVLALVLSRLFIRWRRQRPEWDATLPPWQRRAATAVHALLYVLLVATPSLGYLTAATAPIAIPTLFLGVIPIPHLVGPNQAWFALLRPTHRVAAILLVLLAAGHALAAIHNHRAGRATLTRMWHGKAA